MVYRASYQGEMNDILGHIAMTAVVLSPVGIAAGGPDWAMALALTLSAAGCATLREVAQHRRPGMGLRDIVREINPVDIAEGSLGGLLIGVLAWILG